MNTGWSKTLVIPRRLPTSGQVLVRTGESVRPGDVVARAELTKSTRWTIPAANQLQLDPRQLARYLLVQGGQKVYAGQLLAQRGEYACHAPASGVIEQVDHHRGQICLRESPTERPIPVIVNAAAQLRGRRGNWTRLLHRQVGDIVRRGEVLAGEYPGRILFSPVSGQVLEVDPRAGEIVIVPDDPPLQLAAAVPGEVIMVMSDGCDISCQAETLAGCFRLGGPAYGQLQAVSASLDRVAAAELITPEMAGRIVVLGCHLTGEVFFQARVVGVAGLVAGSAHLVELMAVAGLAQPAAALCADLPDITVLLTEGCGSQPMSPALFEQLQSRTGKHAFISPRHPELLIFQ